MTEQSNRIRIFLFFMLKTSFIRFSNEYTEGQIKKLPGNRKQIKCIIAEIACPAPKWKMCNQVSRLGFILQSAFPPVAVALCPFVSFTVIGIARKSHPNSLGALTHRHFRAITHAIFICVFILLQYHALVNGYLCHVPQSIDLDFMIEYSNKVYLSKRSNFL